MNYWKELGNKTWIDWLKILVAVDIAGAGIGMILNVDMHVFGYLLRVIGIGFVSQIIFGLLYVFVAVLIFKRVFPQKLAQDEQFEAEKMDIEIVQTSQTVSESAKKLAKKIAKITDKAHNKIDKVLDKIEEFMSKRKIEAKEEVQKLINEE